MILVDVTPSAAQAVMAEEGRNGTAVTHLALARSQKAGAGIAGSLYAYGGRFWWDVKTAQIQGRPGGCSLTE